MAFKFVRNFITLGHVEYDHRKHQSILQCASKPHAHTGLHTHDKSSPGSTTARVHTIEYDGTMPIKFLFLCTVKMRNRPRYARTHTHTHTHTILNGSMTCSLLRCSPRTSNLNTKPLIKDGLDTNNTWLARRPNGAGRRALRPDKVSAPGRKPACRPEATPNRCR